MRTLIDPRSPPPHWQSPAAAAATSRETNAVELRGDEYAYVLPETIEGGWTTLQFDEHGRRVHEFALAKLEAAGRSPTCAATSPTRSRRSSRRRPGFRSAPASRRSTPAGRRRSRSGSTRGATCCSASSHRLLLRRRTELVRGGLIESEPGDSARCLRGLVWRRRPQGPLGLQGPAGPTGPKGDAGAQGLSGLPVVDMFTPTQVVEGAVLTCSTSTATSCSGLKLNGLDVRLGASEANRICNRVTGAGYVTANGLGAVSLHFAGTGRPGRRPPRRHRPCRTSPATRERLTRQGTGWGCLGNPSPAVRPSRSSSGRRGIPSPRRPCP